MISKSLFFIISILLVGCSISPNILTNAPPLIEKGDTSDVHVPTKDEFLQAQTPDIRKAFIQYEESGNAMVIATNQIIKIPFGQSTPVIYCTPLRTCEIKLETGEGVTGVYPGDTSRWLFEQAVSGEGVQQQPHIIFKPKDYDLVTNAIITTTRRTYNIELHSQKDVVVKQVEFYYPQDIEKNWNDIQKQAAVERIEQKNRLIQNKKLLNQELDFHYRIETPLFSEKPVWIPYRVFNDGVHVYIQIPQQAETTSLPALFVVGKDNEPKLVNYRIEKPYYIVDQLFQRAVLKIGTGQNETHVTITYYS